MYVCGEEASMGVFALIFEYFDLYFKNPPFAFPRLPCTYF